MGLIMIGMNLRFGANGRVGMFRLDPLDPFFALRPFHFDSYFSPFALHLAVSVGTRVFSELEEDARKQPQLLSIPSLPIGEPTHELTPLAPLPSGIGPLLKQLGVLFPRLGHYPVAATALNKVNSPSLGSDSHAFCAHFQS